MLARCHWLPVHVEAAHPPGFRPFTAGQQPQLGVVLAERDGVQQHDGHLRAPNKQLGFTLGARNTQGFLSLKSKRNIIHSDYKVEIHSTCLLKVRNKSIHNNHKGNKSYTVLESTEKHSKYKVNSTHSIYPMIADDVSLADGVRVFNCIREVTCLFDCALIKRKQQILFV